MHPNWRGEDADYSVQHAWVAKHKTKTGVCDECGAGERKTEWANISGKYPRDLGDYRELCIPCHRRSDAARLARAAFEAGQMFQADAQGNPSFDEWYATARRGGR